MQRIELRSVVPTATPPPTTAARPAEPRAATRAAAAETPRLRAASSPAVAQAALGPHAASAASISPLEPVGEAAASALTSSATQIPVYATRLPPAGQWRYRMQHGLVLGEAELHWAPQDGARYELRLLGRVAGVTLLFDPVLFNSLGLRRRHSLPCRPEDITGIDYLLLSHGHRDHLDEQSMQLLARQNPAMQVLSSLRMGPLLGSLAPSLPVQEAGWWQRYDLGPAAPLEITYLPAAHWHRRGLTDTNKVLWGSFLIRAADKLIYFAGDTAYADHFEAIEARFGPLDIVLIPIGAYKPAFMMSKSHVNPHEAAKAVNVLRAGHIVPMHYGTFDLSDEPASEPLRRLTEVASGGMLRGELHAPAVGEVLRWREWE